ncbi:MAG: porin family protein [Chiayiivirga sp.]|nr:porin family protein [Chiayiivirga sp.]
MIPPQVSGFPVVWMPAFGGAAGCNPSRVPTLQHLVRKPESARSHYLEVQPMRFAITVLLLWAMSFSASAGDLDYTHVGVGWHGVRSDNFSNERGYGLQGSYRWADHWFATGDYRFNDGRATDVSAWLLGLGYRTSLGDRTDGIVRIGAARYELEGLLDRTKSSPFVELAARFDVSPGFDLGLGIRYAEVAWLSDVQLLANANWRFGRWSLVAELGVSGDGETLFLGPRYTFQ